MTELLTAAQMRAIEQAAIESGEVTGLELMERAGRGVVEAIFEEWPELAKTSHRAVVLCGPGNNGGDGFVVARLLKEWGWDVEVFLYGDPEKLPPDAKVNYERWAAIDVVAGFSELQEKHGWQSETNSCFQNEEVCFIDALFGTGLTRALNEELHLFLADARDSSLGVSVCVDVPSGCCSDSGKVLVAPDEEIDRLDSAFPVDLTVTFHKAKNGHFLVDGMSASHRVSIVDIGLGKTDKEVQAHWLVDAFSRDATIAERSKSFGQTAKLTSPNPWETSKEGWFHKYSHGHSLILSGGAGKTGAARLAAKGALRIGAGLVTLGVPPSAQMEVASQITSIMLTRVEDGTGLSAVLEDDRLNALCLGPGLGVERAREWMPVALRAKHTPSVTLDADALTAFATAPDALFEMLHDKCVLTPHGGEFARLFPDIAEKLDAVPTKGPAYSKVDATREAAKRAGCVVLFKGPDTVIAHPDGRCSINSAHYDRAAPWLATAGSGDVLAGFITGLLARGFDPMTAAETAAWLHVECARSFGPGLIAEDLPEELPKVFRDLGL